MKQTKTKKGIYYYMRTLHRDVGFLAIGMTLIYALSGILLIYRDTDFLKTEKQIEKVVARGLSAKELSDELHLRSVDVNETNGDVMYFNNGSYNNATGEVNYIITELRFPFNKLSNLHKSQSSSGLHVFPVIYGIALLFLAVSSYWMYKPGTKHFKRFIIYGGIGLVIAFLLVILI